MRLLKPRQEPLIFAGESAAAILKRKETAVWSHLRTDGDDEGQTAQAEEKAESEANPESPPTQTVTEPTDAGEAATFDCATAVGQHHFDRAQSHDKVTSFAKLPSTYVKGRTGRCTVSMPPALAGPRPKVQATIDEPFAAVKVSL